MDGKLSAEEKELFRTLRKTLRAEFARAGHGSQKRVLAELNISKAAFDSTFNRGAVKILVLVRILKRLNVDLNQFFSHAFPAIDELSPGGVPPVGVKEVQLRRERGDFDD